uniref:glutathione transferase n=1 Tax=Plectus sambesii TaxID=2011161 RepID=A0A914V8D0_9BILA
MTVYRLHYFNYRARAETARILFRLADVPFEDVRIPVADWPQLKPDTPWGSAPVLEVDGEKLAQSRTIELYLARKFGFIGKTEWEAAKIHEILGAIDDAYDSLQPAIRAKDDQERERLLSESVIESIAPFYERLVEKLESNGTGFVVGDSLTVADIALYVWIDGVEEGMIHGVLSRYPKLEEYIKRIASLPKIKEWIDTRPDTPFSFSSRKRK